MYFEIDLLGNVSTDQNQGALESVLEFHNPVIIEHWRNGELIATYETLNDITNEGKNAIFNDFFNAVAGTANWYLSFINNSGYSGVAASDTMASHAGWSEFTTYSQANRVAWGQGTAASQSITNAVAATFDITGTATLKGIFVTTNNTKAGTTGVLWATALFSSDVSVVNGDQLKVSYTVSA